MIDEAEIFADALDLPAADRPAFLDRACGEDTARRARVDALLRGHDEAAGFLRGPLLADRRLTPEEKPGDRIGRYKLLQQIGEGGCGVVYMAEQEEPVRRRVALKVIKLGMDTKAVIARFEAERQALALMDHPNIARVLDAGATEAGRPFFVMELVRGVPITKYCDEKRLPPPARLELFIAVCAAVHHAHRKGIIHRDIKPSNILVTVNDGAPVPKVIDFGIAKATQGRLTEHTLFTAFEQFIGTPVYMSPEQAEMSSVEIDPRSDIYSLGVLLYELLTGQPPFDARAFAQTSVDEIRRHIREVEPPKPSTRWRTLPDAEQTTVANLRGAAPAELSVLLRGDLDWIVMRCLEKDRARRYENASALAADLQRHLRHEPVVARPPRPAYVLGKFIRRHRFGFTAAATLGFTVLVGATVSVWQAKRADRAERLAAELKAPAPPVDPKSIAVLPFENLSTDKDNAFFAAGIHEDILTNLTHLRELHVVSNDSVMDYARTAKPTDQIARELGVAYLLRGSVRRSGTKVRITSRLIRAATDEQVWAETMDRDLSDIFTLQSELAQKIAASLQAALSPQEIKLLGQRPTENTEAYDLYLKARTESRDGQSHERIANLLQGVVALDPKFALGWANLAIEDAHLYGFGYDQSEARLAAAKSAMDTALRLDPEHPEVIRALGEYYYRAYLDYDRALEQFAKLAQSQPNDPEVYEGIAYIQNRQGKPNEALANLRQALALDPGNVRIATGLIATLRNGRRYDDLATAGRRFIALHPNHPHSAIYAHGLAEIPFWKTGSTTEMETRLAGLGNTPSAIRERQAWAAVQGKFDEAIRLGNLVASSTPDDNLLKAWGNRLHTGLNLAVLLAAHGDRDAARALVTPLAGEIRQRLEREPTNSTLWALLGGIEAVLGHPEEALRCARRACELLPETLDASRGAGQREVLAFVYAWTGDKDRALAEYAHVLRVSGDMNVHEMRHAPAYAPLQGDPRFEALLNDPANNAPLFGEGAEPALPNDKSIAVLPFENMSEDKDANAFFSDGIHEDILTNLAHIRELRVVSRQSVLEYRSKPEHLRNIAQKLGVAYILEGSVRRAGDQVRVSSQLIRAATDEPVWAETYTRNLSDIFAIQSELAEKIAASLQAALSPREKTLLEHPPTESLTAYDLYLKARAENRSHVTVDGLTKQVTMLQAAVALDPNFALAWADLAIAHHNFYFLYADHTEARLANAQTALDHALRLAPDEPEVIRSLADSYTHGHRDFTNAAAQFEKLIRLQPNDPNGYSGLAYAQLHRGRWVDAMANFRRSVELDPGNLLIVRNFAALLVDGRRYDESIVWSRRAVAMQPIAIEPAFRLAYTHFLASGSVREVESFFKGLSATQANSQEGLTWRRYWAYVQGNFDEARRLDERMTVQSGNELFFEAVTLAAHGDVSAARTKVAKLPAGLRARLEREPANAQVWDELGEVEALLGHADEAQRCARKSVGLIPESLDADFGPKFSKGLAWVYAWTGDKDRAIAEYARLLRIAASGLNIYEMKHDPAYAPLRGDPRFEALLEDPANNAPLF